MDDIKKLNIRAGRLKYRLKRYIHSERCGNLRECPLRHAECRDRLDLDTAIAFNTHKILNNWFPYNHKHSINVSWEGLSMHIHALHLFWSLLLVHNEKYLELYQLMSEAVFLLRKLHAKTQAEEVEK